MLFFTFGQPAMLLASTQQGYIPPASRTRPQRTQGAGSRGCPQTQTVALQLLIPSDRTARTTVSHPTLAWYLSTVPSTPLQLALTEEGAAKPVFVRDLPVSHPGVMRYVLPSELPGLQSGKEYRWTVSLICNPDRPSQNAYARGWIECVSADSKLVQSLNASTSTSQRHQFMPKLEFGTTLLLRCWIHLLTAPIALLRRNSCKCCYPRWV
ncbi:MAG: DUF928 domain-containing protein [Pseudanabaena sp. CRU_2_10]|nr:DUF928 domain-containing protein [Pseudanabaena sp. CRU_2_10]